MRLTKGVTKLSKRVTRLTKRVTRLQKRVMRFPKQVMRFPKRVTRSPKIVKRFQKLLSSENYNSIETEILFLWTNKKQLSLQKRVMEIPKTSAKRTFQRPRI